MKKLILFSIILSLLSSLYSDDFKKFKNETRIKKNLKSLDLQKVASLPGDLEIDDLTLEEIGISNNIFIKSNGEYLLYDRDRMKMYHLDKDLNLKNSFLPKGNGPGEIEYFMSCLVGGNDTLYVPNFMNRKILKFTPEGEFVKDIEVDGSLPVNIKSANNRMVGSVLEITMTDGKTSKNNVVSLYDDKLSLIKEIYSFKSDMDSGNIFGGGFSFDIDGDKNLLYLSKASEDNYIIEVMDLDGNKLQEINRNYRKIRYTQDELDKFNEENVMIMNGERIKHTATFKESINTIFLDRDQLLWVDAAFDITRGGEAYYDIYEGGSLIAQIKKSELTNEDEELLHIEDHLLYVRDSSGGINIYSIGLN